MGKPHLFLLWKLAGIFPFDSSVNLQLLPLVLSLVFQCLSVHYFQIVLPKYHPHFQDSGLVIYRAETLSPSLAFFAQILMAVVRRREFKNVFDSIPNLRTTKCGNFELLFFVSLSLTVAALDIVCATSGLENFLKTNCCRQNLMSYLILHQFVTILRSVEADFENLVEDFSMRNFNVDRHATLIEFSQKVLSIYGLQLFVFIVTTGIQLTLSAYFLSLKTRFCNFGSNCDWIGTTKEILSITLTLAGLVSLCHRCESTRKEAEKFNLVLFRLMKENQNLAANNKLKLYISMNQTLEFTPCGFLTLGYPMITSIIAGATTYLVILIQLSRNHSFCPLLIQPPPDEPSKS